METNKTVEEICTWYEPARTERDIGVLEDLGYSMVLGQGYLKCCDCDGRNWKCRSYTTPNSSVYRSASE